MSNGGAKIKPTKDNSGNEAKLRKANKSEQTPPTSGGKFKKFIKQ